MAKKMQAKGLEKPIAVLAAKGLQTSLDMPRVLALVLVGGWFGHPAGQIGLEGELAEGRTGRKELVWRTGDC